MLGKNKFEILKILLKMNINIQKTLPVIILINLEMNKIVLNESYKVYLNIIIHQKL